jgi:hypothetical protein
MVEQGSPPMHRPAKSQQYDDAAMNKMGIFSRQLRHLNDTMRVLLVLFLIFSTCSIPPAPTAMAQQTAAASSSPIEFECPSKCRCFGRFFSLLFYSFHPIHSPF